MSDRLAAALKALQVTNRDTRIELSSVKTAVRLLVEEMGGPQATVGARGAPAGGESRERRALKLISELDPETADLQRVITYAKNVYEGVRQSP